MLIERPRAARASTRPDNAEQRAAAQRDRRHVVQLSACRQAPGADVHPVRRLVLRRRRPPARIPEAAAAGLLALFGNINVAVPFLLDLFRIPADTFQLFLATSVVNARFGTLVAASHTVAVALLGTWALAGGWHVDARRVGRYVAITALLGSSRSSACRRSSAGPHQRLRPGQGHREDAVADPASGRSNTGAAPTCRRNDTAPAHDRIRQRGPLRVGTCPTACPSSTRTPPAGWWASTSKWRTSSPPSSPSSWSSCRSNASGSSSASRAATATRHVGAGGHPGARGGAAAFGVVSRRNARPRRPRRGARSLATWDGIRGMASCPSGAAGAVPT